MGSRQKAVDAFSAVCDDSMLDRWIPDEDWVWHIRDNGEIDCTITNLNMGMSRQCVWQNNQANLQGRTVFHNKKKIRISKVTKKQIRFYYVLSAGKPAPTVPSDQGFYQSLWDDPDRSNRSLKRTGPQSQIAWAPQTKKAKTSSVSTAEELPQSASERPLP
jgi:hypothetical protein